MLIIIEALLIIWNFNFGLIQFLQDFIEKRKRGIKTIAKNNGIFDDRYTRGNSARIFLYQFM